MTLFEKTRKLIESQCAGAKKCAVVYSGGLDSTAMLLLLEEAGIKTTAVVLDIGQGKGRLEKSKSMAKKYASQTVCFDAREDMQRNMERAIKANATLASHVNSEGLSRPVLAAYLVRAGRQYNCDVLAHGSSGAGNDQHRMENALRALAPEKKIIAPIRDWNLLRDQCLDYLKAKGAGNFEKETGYSVSTDESAWARTLRIAGKNDDVKKGAYEWTAELSDAPEKKSYATIRFEKGVPTSVLLEQDGKKSQVSGFEIYTRLNEFAGKAGFGRFDAIEDKVIGLKMHESYEAPAACALARAHHELESIVLTSSELEVKGFIDRKWGQLVYDGGFYTRLRGALEAFIERTQRTVDGSVKVAFYKGSMQIISRESPYALYDIRMASRDKTGVINQQDARYFSKLYGLQDSIAFAMGSG
ncbi:argininosuccinate synthase [Candidatus Parvarchaeota archaeon]|nr:argininosuccinate synthase [Candidatus Parvarchaeota archaeon]